jgi:hypothetical protein
MRARALLTGIILSSVIVSGPAFSDPPSASFLPKADLGQFIVDKLDLGSFPSMLGPRLTPSQHTFGGMKLKPSQITAKQIVFDDDDMYILIDILDRGDFNDDGLEDVVVCWTEQAKGGTLNDTTPLLLTRYSADSPLVAIAANVPDEKNCVPDPPLSKR